MYIKPMIKFLTIADVVEDIGPVQTAYAQVMWVQTEPINPQTYNYTVHTTPLADSTIVRLEKKV